jgi:L-xylulokinase
MKNYLMGIDIGGTLIKVVIFDVHGKQVQHSSRKVIANYPYAGWAETDMLAIWQNTADAIREALEKSAIAPGQILAIGTSGHGNGIYLLDKDKLPLRSSIMSLDTRAEAFIKKWNASSEYHLIWQKTYQQLWAAQPPALLAWLKENERENYKNIGAILMCKDYIKFCLTEQASTDYSDISASSLFDIGQRTYSDELLKIYGITECRDALPYPVESYVVAGKVTSKAAGATGLLEGTPVVGGLFDVSATALGAGVIATGQACLIAGTWSVNEVVTSEPVDDKQLFMNSIYVPDHYMAIEASATSAINLEWFVRHFCAEESAEAEQRGISVFDICNERVEQINIGSGNLFFHPFLFGSNVQASARAGFYGVGGWHTKNHLLRAVYEGVVYGHMSHIEKLKSSDIQMDMARFTGGAARSPVWVQMFADAIGIPMEVVEGEEMGAHGAAMCAGIGAGVYENYQDAVEKTVIVKNRYEPDHQHTILYRERFVEYQNLVQVMNEAWNRLSKL